MPTATQSYVKFNSLINVDVIKVDKNIDKTFDQAWADKEEMLSTTVLFNSFETTIDASYFAPDSSISGANFTMYRKTPEQKYYDFVCEMQDGEYRFTDYNVVNNQYYHYLAAIELQTSSGIPEYQIYQNREEDGSLSYEKTSWGSWAICDVEESDEDENIYVKTGKTWTLMYNISEENLSQNISVTSWDTLGRFPKFSIGERNYDSSSFMGLLGEMKEFRVYDTWLDILDDKYVVRYNYTEREEAARRSAWQTGAAGAIRPGIFRPAGEREGDRDEKLCDYHRTRVWKRRQKHRKIAGEGAEYLLLQQGNPAPCLRKKRDQRELFCKRG